MLYYRPESNRESVIEKGVKTFLLSTPLVAEDLESLREKKSLPVHNQNSLAWDIVQSIHAAVCTMS